MRTLILALVLFLALTGYVWGEDFTTTQSSSGLWSSNVITGSSANTFPGTAQAVWNAGPYEIKSLSIINTDGSASLDYYVTFKVTANSSAQNLPNHGTASSPVALAAGESALVSTSDSIAELSVYIKSTAADTPANFETSASGQKRVVPISPR